jgi:hypothetical protein
LRKKERIESEQLGAILTSRMGQLHVSVPILASCRGVLYGRLQVNGRDFGHDVDILRTQYGGGSFPQRAAECEINQSEVVGY